MDVRSKGPVSKMRWLSEERWTALARSYERAVKSAEAADFKQARTALKAGGWDDLDDALAQVRKSAAKPRSERRYLV